MKNSVSSLSIPDLVHLGEQASTGAKAVGKEAGLAINKATLIEEDYQAADAAVLAYQTAVADRVDKATAFADALASARKWCFRAKETLKPFLGDTHSSLWRPTGFTNALRVPDDYAGLFALTDKLSKYLAAHEEQTNDSEKVMATAARAEELRDGLRTASAALTAHDELIETRHSEQEGALQGLRDRLRGLVGELKQIIGLKDPRWHRFGLNVPAEAETPAPPEEVRVNNTTPGQLLASCPPVPYAERYRFFVQKAGATGEPVAVGTSSEPLFVIEPLDPGARYQVFVSAVNLAGNEGPRSKAFPAEVLARAA